MCNLMKQFIRARFVQTLNGSRLLLYNQYPFSKNGRKKRHWQTYACCKRLSLKCAAFINISMENQILKACTEHNHPPPANGARRRGGIRWFCSYRNKGCPVTLIMNEDTGRPVMTPGPHPHQPPTYVQMGEPNSSRPQKVQTYFCMTVTRIARTVASATVASAIQFIHLFNGRKLLMVDGFTFHKIAGVSYTGGIRWQCSSRKLKRCKAFVVLSKSEDVVLRVVGFHTHEPPIYKLTKQGTKLLMVDGFTFHKVAGVSYSGGIRWRCSSRKLKGCKAFVVLSKGEDVVLRLVGYHTHEPPIYKLTNQGTYIKV
ncbi:unnamed protein product, partial [Iphiclides podalirius]